jgi:hypothetical protein
MLTAAMSLPVFADTTADTDTDTATEVDTASELTAAVANGGSIKLTGNITDSITITKDTTIDLNGYSLTNDEGKDTITVQYGATLNLDSGSTQGTVNNTSHGYAALFNNGTSTVGNVKLYRSSEVGTSSPNSANGNSYYTIVNHGKMTIANSLVKNEGSYSSMIENGYADYSSTDSRSGQVDGVNADEAELTISSGTFDGGKYNVKNDDGGVLTINGGTFQNGDQCAIYNVNEATINDGTFSAASTATCVLSNTKLNSTTDKGELVVKGGTFNVTGDTQTVFGFAKLDGITDATVEIDGGTFDKIQNAGDDYSGLDYTNFTINGGTFNDLDGIEYEDANGNTALVSNITLGTGKEIINNQVVTSNSWTKELTIDDIPYGGTLEPSASAAHGDVTYTYYDSSKNKLSSDPTMPGTYYVKATVDSDEYADLESDYVKFFIYKPVIRAKATTSGTSVRFYWTKVSGADGYKVYYARCGKSLKAVKYTASNSWTKKGLSKGKNYKFVVKAYKKVNGKKVYFATSRSAHTIVGGYNSKYTVAKSISVKTSTLTLTAGSTKTLKPSQTKYKSSRNLLPSSHIAKYRYSSSNKAVATVSSKGVVTAKKAGTCRIYIFAQNGRWTSVKVTVE